MDNEPEKTNNYWTDLLIPASGGLLTKEAVLGYLHSKGKLPEKDQLEQSFRNSLNKIDESLPFRHLGKPGVVSTISGLAAASSLYFIFRDTAAHHVSEPQHQGTLEGKKLRR